MSLRVANSNAFFPSPQAENLLLDQNMNIKIAGMIEYINSNVHFDEYYVCETNIIHENKSTSVNSLLSNLCCCSY